MHVTHHNPTSTDQTLSNRGRFTVVSCQIGVENRSKTCRFGAALGPVWGRFFRPLHFDRKS